MNAQFVHIDKKNSFSEKEFGRKLCRAKTRAVVGIPKTSMNKKETEARD
jgi:hypothetical protein